VVQGARAELAEDPRRALARARANYLCGEKITIADYLGAGFVSLGEIIRLDFAAYPNVKRWLDNMKKLKSWPKVNEVFYGFRDAVKDQPFVTL